MNRAGFLGGSQDIRALAARVPGLNIETSNGRTQPRFYLRGLGNIDFDVNANQPVAMVFDEISLENNVLRSIPGLKLVEMQRIKEYSWCCGAGGGVIDAYPEYNMNTAVERIKEAIDTGAEAIVSSCPWCIRNFKDAIGESEENLEVYDVIEIFEQSI